MERKEEPGSEAEDAGRGPWKLETVRWRDSHQGGDGWQGPGLSQAAGGSVAGQDAVTAGTLTLELRGLGHPGHGHLLPCHLRQVASALCASVCRNMKCH